MDKSESIVGDIVEKNCQEPLKKPCMPRGGFPTVKLLDSHEKAGLKRGHNHSRSLDKNLPLQDQDSGIDKQNRERLESMTPQEILKAQTELYETLSVNVIQNLISRGQKKEQKPARNEQGSYQQPRNDTDANLSPILDIELRKQEWMRDLDQQDNSSYSAQTKFPLEIIRFDFEGNIISPKDAEQLPTFLGLHHHSNAPGLAGYTIPELAHLCRSSFPAQRCIATRSIARLLQKIQINAYMDKNLNFFKLLESAKVYDFLEQGSKSAHQGVQNISREALVFWESIVNKYFVH